MPVRIALLCLLTLLLAGCGLQSRVSLELEQMARRQLPLVHVWEISVRVTNDLGEAVQVDPADFTVTDSAGESHVAGVSAAMTGLGLAPVVTLPSRQSAVTKLLFTLPADRTPASLTHAGWGVSLSLPDK